MNSWARRHQGFTIVELLIVVVVIAILAAIVIVAYNGIQDKTRQSAAKESLSTASKKIQTSRIQNDDTLPVSLSSLGIENTSTVSYQYAVNTSFVPNTYCVTTTSGKYSYHIATGGVQTDGPCPGHTGNAPEDLNCPTGFVTVPGNSLFGTQAFCVMKYEAKQSGSVAVSTAASVPWASINRSQAQDKAATACSGCHLMTLDEWLTIANNALNVPSNWSGGAVGSGTVYSGHNDGAPASRIAASASDSDGYYGTENSSGNQRRTLTLSNGQVIWDFVGNVWEWVDETTSGAGNQPGLTSDSAYAYKKWTVANVQTGAYAKVFPGYGSAQAAAGGWSDTQGLGKMITNYNDDAERAFFMGGAYTTGYVNGGLFTLRTNNSTAESSVSTGFRAAYTP